MSNLKLTFPVTAEIKTIKAQRVNSCGKIENYTSQITELRPPYPCVGGDRMIVFVKDPTKIAGGAGVFVADIITRALEGDQYAYYLSYPDAYLAPGVLVNSLTQCDILNQCCYDCQTDYLCRLLATPNCEGVQDCIAAAMFVEDGFRYDDVANRFSVAISEDEGNQLTQHADGLYALTSVEGVIDCTLRRDGDGIIGINDLAEPTTGHASLVGIDANGCAVRVLEYAAIAVLTDGTAEPGAFAALTPIVVDYDNVQHDPAGMITPGADWLCTIKRDGRYQMNAHLRYGNAEWGHHGSGDFAAIQLYYKVNGGIPIPLAVTYASDVDNAAFSQALEVGASKLLNLQEGDTIQLISQHTDTALGPVHGFVTTGTEEFSFFTIHRIG